jgi:hypothetical protein
MGFADHLAALANRRFQSVEFAHGLLLARRLVRDRSPVAASEPPGERVLCYVTYRA